MSFIKKIKNQGCRRLLSPIVDNPIFFIFQFIIINAPVWTYWITQFCPYLRLYAILAAPITTFSAYILTAIIKGIPKLKIPFYIITYALSIFEVFIILNFGVRFSHSIYQLIVETTLEEARGFFMAYVFTLEVLMYVIFVVGFMGVNLLQKSRIM